MSIIKNKTLKTNTDDFKIILKHKNIGKSIKFYSFSFFKTDSGEFLTIPILFPTPSAKTNNVIAGRIIKNGTHEGVKVLSNNI